KLNAPWTEAVASGERMRKLPLVAATFNARISGLSALVSTCVMDRSVSDARGPMRKNEAIWLALVSAGMFVIKQASCDMGSSEKSYSFNHRTHAWQSGSRG